MGTPVSRKGVVEMRRLKAVDLQKIKERVRKEGGLESDKYAVKITVHMGTCGIAAGADKVYEALKEEIETSKRDDINVVISACMGMCSSEPNVTVWRRGEDAVLYKDVDAEKMRQIYKGHVSGGEIKQKHALARIREPL